MQAAFAGVNLDEAEGGTDDPEKKLKMAEAKLKNPLVDFPDDVKYLNAADCDVKIRLTNDPKLCLPFKQKWNSYRKDCCLGEYGKAARRCSVNDTLWERYLASAQAGRPISLEVIKGMVEFDMLRSELYPKNFKGSPGEDPPEYFINELKESGKYTDILQKLDQITKRIQNSGS